MPETHETSWFDRWGDAVRSLGHAARALKDAARAVAGGSVDQLAQLYGNTLDYRGPERNPVILIPGILGTKLVEAETGRIAWGAFSGDFADPKVPADLRLLGLRMQEGLPLADSADGVTTSGVLDRFRFALAGLPVQTSAYVDIIRTLSAGGFNEQTCGCYSAAEKALHDAEPEDTPIGPGAHRDAFQFPWDWRRDLTESAESLGRFIEARREDVRRCRRERGEDDSGPVRFDVVAHSMGGLLARYYLMHGPHRLPEQGPVPEPTYAGAADLDRVIVVGSPAAGSVASLVQLVEGKKVSATLPFYPPAVLGTMTGVYQLLPRPRLNRVYDEGGAAVDLYDPAVWEHHGWGLAGGNAAEDLRHLLPDAADDAERRRVALDHLAKCLACARRTHEALDAPLRVPVGRDGHRPELYLMAGDLLETTCTLKVSGDGSLREDGTSPGDGVVTRASALLDERIVRPPLERPLRLRSPIRWDHVTFLPGDHMGLTRHPLFVDNLLHLLLEKPRRGG